MVYKFGVIPFVLYFPFWKCIVIFVLANTYIGQIMKNFDNLLLKFKIFVEICSKVGKSPTSSLIEVFYYNNIFIFK